MNDDLKFKLLRFQHEIMMAKRNIVDGRSNSLALEPMFKYAVDNKDEDILVQINQEFIIRTVDESKDADNVNEIGQNNMLAYLDDLMHIVKNKIE